MAHYTIKTEDKLRWNSIRRVITREYDTRMMNRRERDLNRLIADAEQKFVRALSTGEELVVESHYARLVDAILRDHVTDLDVLDPEPPETEAKALGEEPEAKAPETISGPKEKIDPSEAFHRLAVSAGYRREQ